MGPVCEEDDCTDEADGVCPMCTVMLCEDHCGEGLECPDCFIPMNRLN